MPRPKKQRIIVFDTETTGIYYTHDEILQLAIIDGDGKELFNEYFKPSRHTAWSEAEAVNHISPDMVAKKPSIDKKLKKIQSIFDKADMLVGYNLKFDINFLQAAGIVIPTVEQFDVMWKFAELCGEVNERGNYRRKTLSECAEYYNYQFDDAHDALGDSKATLHCYKCMTQKKEEGQ